MTEPMDRTWKSPLPINARDFGVVGDGVTDDTAAFQAFRDECKRSGRPGFVPAGMHVLLRALRWRDDG